MTEKFYLGTELPASGHAEAVQATNVFNYVSGVFLDSGTELSTKLGVIHEMLSAFMKVPTSDNTDDISHETFYHVADVVSGATKLMVDLSVLFALSQDSSKPRKRE